jgi:hypothetical protein
MSGPFRIPLSLGLSFALCSFACADEGDIMDSGLGSGVSSLGTEGPMGDGDGDGMMTGDGDGDGPDTTTGTDPNACDVPSPYQGGWRIGCCQDEITPTPWNPGGIGQGSVLPDWTFTDQFGDSLRVWDFCHDAIYFEYVAFW